MLIDDFQTNRLSTHLNSTIEIHLLTNLFCEDEREDDVKVEEEADQSEQGEDQTQNHLQSDNFHGNLLVSKLQRKTIDVNKEKLPDT